MTDESEDVKEVVQNLIKTKIIKALTDEAGYINALVEAALNDKVDAKGRKGNSYRSRDEKYPFLDIIVKEEIQNACREAVKEIINQRRNTIYALISQKLKQTNIADAFTDAIVKNCEKDWRVKISFDDAGRCT